jgi:hypothetical protein
MYYASFMSIYSWCQKNINPFGLKVVELFMSYKPINRLQLFPLRSICSLTACLDNGYIFGLPALEQVTCNCHINRAL